ncbi:MAG TPA: ASKHA domain-containing protein [Methanomassiliicoccales archaeon]|nr:ASKHA domain-containing protein [Methanomassiliicoccales archaeon]HPR98113.1 ASKHA domain-containing protein [Methanomassiliicoccales archaeon]
MSPQVTFHPKGRSIEAPVDTNLLEAAILAGVEINSACAGKGVCGRCRVVVEGDVDSQNTPRITEEDRSNGYRLACLSKVKGDCIVFVPEESQLKPMQIVGGKVSTDLKQISPLVRAIYAKLRPPTLQDNDADLERLLKQLGYEPGALEVPLSLLRELPRAIREGEWTVTAFLDGNILVDVLPWNVVSRNFGVSVDIGTTTVALQLVDLSTGEMISQVSDYNRQLMYGEDVLARIMYSEDHGLERLRHTIVDTINHMLARVCNTGDVCVGKGKKVCAEEIMAVSVAGNTTMMHMLLGLDPKCIRYAPYTPVTNLSPRINASELGLNVNPRASVHLVPGRASYVGGDVVADVVASGMARNEGISLLIDVGTNGEIVLGNNDWLLACSASAGPAFEGGEVCHGMRAGDGAIEKVSLKGGVEYSTIGKVRPKGICGSGLIDLLAQLFLTGVLDKKGHLQPSERVRDGEFGKEYVLVYSKDVERDGYDVKATGMSCCPTDKVERRRDITVTEEDIANIVRTKASLYAAAEVLLDTAGIDFTDLERVYIAGGFGHHIDLDNAVAIGLLPDLPRERFTFLGNASLDGAKLCLLSQEKREEALAAHRAMTYVELSTDQRFFDRFSSASFLPHTDLSRFPSIEQIRG